MSGLKQVTIYTDGACAGNPGPGGYAAVLLHGEHRREITGGYRLTTNNRMELMAVIAGLRILPKRARVRIHIDSSYVKDNFENCLPRWQDNGWLKTNRKPVLNIDLWKKLSTEVDRRKVEWVKVAGHTGVELNELADRLACAQKDAYAERSRRLVE